MQSQGRRVAAAAARCDEVGALDRAREGGRRTESGVDRDFGRHDAGREKDGRKGIAEAEGRARAGAEIRAAYITHHVAGAGRVHRNRARHAEREDAGIQHAKNGKGSAGEGEVVLQDGDGSGAAAGEK